jgi:hypothetical protein
LVGDAAAAAHTHARKQSQEERVAMPWPETRAARCRAEPPFIPAAKAKALLHSDRTLAYTE